VWTANQYPQPCRGKQKFQVHAKKLRDN